MIISILYLSICIISILLIIMIIRHKKNQARLKEVEEKVQQLEKENNRLKQMLKDYNDGRSKTYYCIAATVLGIEELKYALKKAKTNSDGMDIKERAKVLHSILDEIAKKKNYLLKLRK